MEVFVAKVSYSNLDEKKVIESYLIEALSYTEAEASVLEHLSGLTTEGVEIKSLRMLNVDRSIGLEAYTSSSPFFLIGSIPSRGKRIARKALVRESNAIEACKAVSDGREEVIISVRIIDVVDFVRPV